MDALAFSYFTLFLYALSVFLSFYVAILLIKALRRANKLMSYKLKKYERGHKKKHNDKEHHH